MKIKKKTEEEHFAYAMSLREWKRKFVWFPKELKDGWYFMCFLERSFPHAQYDGDIYLCSRKPHARYRKIATVELNTEAR